MCVLVQTRARLNNIILSNIAAIIESKNLIGYQENLTLLKFTKFNDWNSINKLKGEYLRYKGKDNIFKIKIKVKINNIFFCII